VDRYGKKYSLIAFFELQGWLQDAGQLERREDFGRTWDVDIDPSFPSPTLSLGIVSDDLLGKWPGPLSDWITKGPVPNLRRYLRLPSISGEVGPWVALDGFVSRHNESDGRRVFAFIRTFLIPTAEAKIFRRLLLKQPLGGRWLPEKEESHYVFAGEVPWCDA